MQPDDRDMARFWDISVCIEKLPALIRRIERIGVDNLPPEEAK